MAFLTRLARKAALASEGPFSSRLFFETVLQEVSIVLARFNARMENAVSGHLLRPAGHEFVRAHVAVSCDVADGG